MELIRNTFRNDQDKNTVLKTMKPPDLTLLGNGSMGILTRNDFRAEGFSPATFLPVSGGFQITRWLYVEDSQGEKQKRSVQQVQEFVGADGTYHRTVQTTHMPPKLPNSQLSIPRFE